MTERLPSTNLTDQNVAAVWKTLKEMFTLTRILSTIWILKTAQFDVVNMCRQDSWKITKSRDYLSYYTVLLLEQRDYH